MHGYQRIPHPRPPALSEPSSCVCAMGYLVEIPWPCGKCSSARPARLHVPPASGFFRDWGECGAWGGWSASGEVKAFPLEPGAAARGRGRLAARCAVLHKHRGVSGALLLRAPGRRHPDRDPGSVTAVPRSQSHRLARGST